MTSPMLRYEVDEGLAWITINRPERYNAFRARTVDELVMAFKRARASALLLGTASELVELIGRQLESTVS